MEKAATEEPEQLKERYPGGIYEGASYLTASVRQSMRRRFSLGSPPPRTRRRIRGPPGAIFLRQSQSHAVPGGVSAAAGGH
jgi:hypothetical protein